MIIKTIDEMEKVVSSNKELFWDGWTVVKRYPSDKAKTSKQGVFIKGIWYMEQRFEPTAQGWEIPVKLGSNA
jgi:hypothetical protein